MKHLPRKEIISKRGRKGFELAPEVLNDTSSIVAFLRTRRSAEPAAITAPGPDDGQLALIMEAATRVPDHGKMEPWRFIILRGDARLDFAALLKSRWQQINPDQELDKRSQHDLFLRAPLIIAVVSRARPHVKIPAWEQHLSAGAACMNIVTMATALGLAAQWRSGWLAEDARIMEILGLEEADTLAGFIFIGSRNPGAPPAEDRRRPYWRDVTRFWKAPGNA